MNEQTAGLLAAETARRESFADFARRIHQQCPDDVRMSIDLSAEMVVTSRGLCGEDGRVIPTRQGLCPRCGGYVEKIDAQRLRELRRLRSELRRMP